jgi:hypothetical protein
MYSKNAIFEIMVPKAFEYQRMGLNRTKITMASSVIEYNWSDNLLVWSKNIGKAAVHSLSDLTEINNEQVINVSIIWELNGVRISYW